MARELVPEAALLEDMNQTFVVDSPQCLGCQFTHIQRLPSGVLDKIGCNWSYANFRCTENGNASCDERARMVHEFFKENYNLAD